ncbi:MAG TPA: outer membrane lipoprotein carrier protein LolA, partial [Vicinamibacteria bacterium]|nr:outer membrane lipoprotein carrier protein LolA [Vicinamibacteria bacterium]
LFIGGPALDSPQRILERMRAAQSNLQSLKARVEQVKSYPQLGIEDPVEKGFLYFQPGRIRLEIQEPEIRILAVKDGKYVLYQPRIRQAIVGKLGAEGTKGLFPGLLTGSRESFGELEKSYEASDLGESSIENSPVHHLSFQARPGAAVYCQAIELFIDAASMLPVRQKCREANQSEITLTLADIERNMPLAKSLFEVEIPEGVEKIERGGDE